MFTRVIAVALLMLAAVPVLASDATHDQRYLVAQATASSQTKDATKDAKARAESKDQASPEKKAATDGSGSGEPAKDRAPVAPDELTRQMWTSP